MKLNPDCVRDVLLYLEENLTYIEDETATRIQEINWHTLFKDEYLLSTYSIEDGELQRS